MKNLVEFIDKEPKVSHRVIAKNTGREQSSISRLITEYKTDFEEFGAVGFKIKEESLGLGSKFLEKQQPKTYYLNEQQATLLMTYLRNNEVVRAFKKQLIKEFYNLKVKQIKESIGFNDSMPDRELLETQRNLYDTTLELEHTKYELVSQKLKYANAQLSLYESREDKEREELEQLAFQKDKEIEDLEKTKTRLKEELFSRNEIINILKTKIDNKDKMATDRDSTKFSLTRKNISKELALKIIKFKFRTRVTNKKLAEEFNVCVTDIPTILKFFNINSRTIPNLEESDFRVKNNKFKKRLEEFEEILHNTSKSKRDAVLQRKRQGADNLDIRAEFLLSVQLYKEYYKNKSGE